MKHLKKKKKNQQTGKCMHYAGKKDATVSLK